MQPEDKKELNIVFDFEGNLKSVFYKDHDTGDFEVIHIINQESAILSMNIAGEISSETISLKEVINWIDDKSSIEGVMKMIGGNYVDEERFYSKIIEVKNDINGFDIENINLKLTEGTKIEEIEEIKNAGMFLKIKVKKIVKDGEVTEEEYNNLLELQKKAEEKLKHSRKEIRNR